MTTDAKQAIDELNQAWAEFRQTNDQRLGEMEKSITRTADGVTTEVTEKLNSRIDEAIDAVKAAEKRAEEAELAAKRMGKASEELAHVKASDLRALKAMNGGRDVNEQDYLERREAVQAYLRKGRTDKLEAKAMSVDNDPEGGYMVMPDTSGRIATFVFESSPMRQFAAIQTITTDSLEGMQDLDEAASGWVGEEQSRPETDTPDLGKWRIPVHELYAEPRATQKLLDDASVDIEAWLADKVAAKFSRAEAAAFVTGDGVLKPRGFTTYTEGTPSSSTYERIERTVTGANGAFPAAGSGSGDPLIDIVFSMKAPYRAGAVFAMNRSTMGLVRKLKDADDNYYFVPDLSQGGSGTILGYPASEFNDLADVSTGSLSIAFANFGIGYQIVDRLGVRVLRDPFTAKPYVKFYTTKRVGGGVVNFEAIKLMEFSAS